MRVVKGQRKRDHRWKWMAGATAASAAAATGVQASTVTVTLTNNFLSNLPDNSLSANIFGNGDLFAFATAGYFGAPSSGSAHLKIATNYANNGGGSALASFNHMGGQYHLFVKIASAGGTVSDSRDGLPAIFSVTKTLNIRFSDPSVNGGAITDGLLQLTADVHTVNLHQTRSQITLNSFSYNINMPAGVPEGGSTLALLALGAGGVMAFRRSKKAA